MTLDRRSIAIFGCGYLGGQLAHQALQKGYKVIALTRNSTTAQTLQKAGVHRVVVAELESSTWHAAIEPDQNWVVNCVSSASSGIEGYRKSYLLGQQSLFSWAQKGRIATYLYTSSTSVYPQTNGVWVDETSPTDSVTGTSCVLLEAEQAISEAHCGRWFILRLAGIYGPKRHLMLDRLLAGETTFEGSSHTILNLIHRDAICAAIWTALTASASYANRIYNVVDDAPTPRGEVVNWLADRLHRERPRFVDMSSKALAQDDRLRMRWQCRSRSRRICNRKIKRELSWRPCYRDFRAGYGSILKGLRKLAPPAADPDQTDSRPLSL